MKKKGMKIAVLLLALLTLVMMSCKKKISKADLEFQVGQSVTEYLEEQMSGTLNALTQYGLVSAKRFETKVTLIKEGENRYTGDAIIEMWTEDENGGDGPGTKDAEEKRSIIVIVDPDDGSFRWEMQN